MFHITLMFCFLLVSCHETDEEMKENSLKLVLSVKQFQQKKLSRAIEKGMNGNAECAWVVAQALIRAYENCMWSLEPDSSMEEAKRLGIKWMNKSAELRCPYAMIDMIWVDDYYMGSVLSDSKRMEYTEEAYKILKSKEVKNGMDSLYLFKCYQEGVGTKKNYWLALTWAIRYVVRFTSEERERRTNRLHGLE